jgi:uncharacterized protein YgiM (DUF1202 family)
MKLGRILLVTGFVMLLATTVWSDSGLMSVQVREGRLRSTPSFLGAIVGPVAYGDRVRNIEQRGEWLDVKSSNNLTGWIHQSALTSKLVVLSSGAAVSSSANSQEVALAGKGFNEDVERQYRSDNSRISYAWVDHMQGYKVSRDQMIAFLAQGKVKPPQGGQR